MPTIQQMNQVAAQHSEATRSPVPDLPINPPPAMEARSHSMSLHCPMPGASAAPDSLAQFYRHGVAQYRIFPAKSLI
jgi:hypothetical protein